METPTPHFAEDQEKLEAYVLRQLDAETIGLLDEHVRSCEACRQAVNQERLLAAGVKSYGREQLRRRLNARLGTLREEAAGGSSSVAPRQRSERRVPWPHLLSIAAVVIIIVGVGIQQRWFVKYVEQENLVTSEQLQQEEGGEGGSRESRSQTNDSREVQPGEPGPREAAKGQKPQGVETGRAALEAAPRDEESRDAMSDKPAKETGAEPTQRSAAENRPSIAGYNARAKEDVRRAEEKDAMQDVTRPSAGVASPGSGGVRQEFWTDGRLIPGERARRLADEVGRMEEMMKKEARAAEGAQGEPETLGNVTLEQRPASRLPETQQRQQLYDPGTIQTLVRQTERETQLTLFPASPFDSTQLHYARVQQVGPDSIIVQIGDQQIGYRLPAPALRQMQLQMDSGKTKR